MAITRNSHGHHSTVPMAADAEPTNTSFWIRPSRRVRGCARHSATSSSHSSSGPFSVVCRPQASKTAVSGSRITFRGIHENSDDDGGWLAAGGAIPVRQERRTRSFRRDVSRHFHNLRTAADVQWRRIRDAPGAFNCGRSQSAGAGSPQSLLQHRPGCRHSHSRQRRPTPSRQCGSGLPGSCYGKDYWYRRDNSRWRHGAVWRCNRERDGDGRRAGAGTDNRRRDGHLRAAVRRRDQCTRPESTDTRTSSEGPCSTRRPRALHPSHGTPEKHRPLSTSCPLVRNKRETPLGRRAIFRRAP